MPTEDQFVRYMRARQSITDSLQRGRRASTKELRQGHDFAGGSLTLDAQIWAAEELDQTTVDAVAIELLQKIVQRGASVSLLQKLEAHYSRVHDVDGALRCIVYLACQGDGLARTRLAANLVVNTRSILTPEALHRHAVAIGLLQGPQASMHDYLKAGFTLVQQAGATSEKMLQALLESTEKLTLDDAYHDADQTAGDELLATLQGMPQAPGVVVVPPFDKPGTGERAKPKMAVHPIAGKRLPLIATGDVRSHQLVLEGRAPHLRELFLTMLGDTAMSPHVSFRPTILVGAKGAGKSWAAAQIAETLGLPFSVFDASSSADGTFGGTAAHWSTSGVCEPLRLVRDTAIANPLMIVEEVEKASSSPHNGSLHHALLLFTEPETARRYRDPAIEMAVDLSHVNYVMTANSLAGIPGPLLDRCRIIEVPAPEWQHVGSIVRGIVEKIRAGIVDPRLVPDLAPDEIEAIARQWRGGSLRRLRDITTAYVQRGSLGMGRA